MLNVIVLTVVMLTVIMLIVIMLTVVMLTVAMLNVIMLNVVVLMMRLMLKGERNKAKFLSMNQLWSFQQLPHSKLSAHTKSYLGTNVLSNLQL